MVRAYDEWKDAVRAEFYKLSNVSHYLNEAGKTRLEAFSFLYDLTCFCDTPGELVEYFERLDGFSADDIKKAKSQEIAPALRVLRLIAASTQKSE